MRTWWSAFFAHWAVAWALAAFIAPFGRAQGVRGLEKIWELDLGRAVPKCKFQAGYRTPVEAIRFSPVNDYVAASVGECPDGDVSSQVLVVAPVTDPALRVVSGAVHASDDASPRPSVFDWSPDGRAISVHGELIRVADGASCSTGSTDGGVFLARDRWLGLSVEGLIPTQRSVFSIYGLDCRKISRWTIEDGCSLDDVSPRRDLVLLTCAVRPGSGKILLVRGADGARVRTWSYDESVRRDAPSGLLGDGGRVICGASGGEGGSRLRPACWDADTGRRIGRPPSVSFGDADAPAREASRVVVTEMRRTFHLSVEDPFDDVPARRVVWDFGTGKEIASWPVRIQTYLVSLKNSKRVFRDFWRYAISADGKFVAEGGAGMLVLYRITGAAIRRSRTNVAQIRPAAGRLQATVSVSSPGPFGGRRGTGP